MCFARQTISPYAFIVVSILIEKPSVSCYNLLMLRRAYPLLAQRSITCMTSSNTSPLTTIASSPGLTGPVAVTALDSENQRPTKKAKTETLTIGTHNGTFHCDEALAVFLL